ncbi:MAG: type IV toxin-antitoxin system AbiEi family antitoxin domain-containing protein [Proteobacteria bacterium]|nr:type IV toxin-antitoxin system AbiEi family antitoxin domain-containing protein [Pseudomonadota bacterium]MBI3497138.1 type IV toxin-antitoxin system AbiEi family antitoxin domain-containing protein [Pseudomonadota bacterium]
MTTGMERQQDRAIALLSQQGMARLSELTDAGITAATVSRMERKGKVIRLARGLYQLPEAPLDANHSLAEAAKLVPKGIICLQSALAFHDLTNRIPPSIWMAIGVKDWRPRITSPPIQIMRFGPKVFESGIETHVIEGVPVRIYGAAKTVVDAFRHCHMAGRLYSKSLGYNLAPAIEGLRNALRQRKATPAEIARFAVEDGPKTWELVRLSLEAFTVDA